MYKRFIAILLAFIFISFCGVSKELDSLLRVLDKTIAERKEFDKLKQDRIDNIKKMLSTLKNSEQIYSVNLTLLNEYRSFNADSALHYVQATDKLATTLNSQYYTNQVMLNRIDIMAMYGMYADAIEIINRIDVKSLPKDMLPQYYHVNRLLYGLMADYSVTERETIKYQHLTDLYRDSLLLVNEKGSFVHTLVKADMDNVAGRYDNAIESLNKLIATTHPLSHEAAIVAYTLANSYHESGNVEQEKKNLIIASIADIQTSTKEYAALWKLSLLLYAHGDIERAYNYLKCSMEDATACNARLRTIESSKVFPIIDTAYQNTVNDQNRKTHILLLVISIVSIMLLITVLYVLWQMKKLSRTRAELRDANDKLKNMNDDLSSLNISLHQSNKQLMETNKNLIESNIIREEYLGRYMDNCSEYITKMDNYRRSMNRLASAGKVEALFSMLKSNQFIEDEVEAFYVNFDNTFLQLFPNFVESFNDLLVEEERIHLKSGELLNTELRIFALIRLGISDSVKISHFLRYSVTTIYNYRTRMRNKAAGKRDEFEDMVRIIVRR